MIQFEPMAGVLLAHACLSEAPVVALHHDEQALLEKRVHPQAQKSFLAGRRLAKYLAAQLLGGSDVHWRVTQQPNGAPQLRDKRGHVTGGISISHSRERIAVMLSATPQRLGVDIEAMRTRESPRDVLEMICAESELHWYDAQPNAERFYQLWTAKEAIAKALQTGLWHSKNRDAQLNPAVDGKAWRSASGLQIFHFHHAPSQHIGAWACNATDEPT